MIIILLTILICGAILLLLYYLQLYFIALYFSCFLIFIILIVLILIFIEAYRVIFKGHAPYICSSNKLIKKIIKEINFKQNSVVYDLGCGDGRFLRRLKKYKQINGVGYEYFILPYIIGQIYNLFSKNKVKIKLKNFFKADLSKADYVFCYLITDEMVKLEKKLKQELKPGALVISNTFKFKNWQPKKFIVIDEKRKKTLSNKLYIYKK
jgi:SAM-dependent methyltransferase